MVWVIDFDFLSCYDYRDLGFRIGGVVRYCVDVFGEVLFCGDGNISCGCCFGVEFLCVSKCSYV